MHFNRKGAKKRNSLTSLLAAAEIERLNLEQSNQENQNVNSGIGESNDCNCIDENDTENMDARIQCEEESE